MSLVGTRLELDVTAVAHGGHMVARHDDRVVFVRHALVGERVVAEVTKGRERDRFLFADAVEIVRASPDRVPAPCPAAGPGRCGGCDFQHIALERQRALKAEVVREQLQRLAGLDVDVTVEPLPGDEDGLRWRTRVEFAVDAGGRAGLRRHRSHDVVPLEDCLIARRDVIDTGVLQRRWSQARSVDVVAPAASPAVLVEVPADLDDVPVVHEQVRARERTYDVEVDARGFFQVHPGAASTFVTHVLERLRPQRDERVLDLYAGVGVFARAFADEVGPDGAVLAVEADRTAVATGRAACAHLDQVEFRDETVERALAPLVEGGDRVDLVVLDPPRAGAGTDVLTQILGLGPRAVAYVACDPASLARDLAVVGDAGYELTDLVAYDAFPMTHHVECIAVLEPVRARTRVS